MYRVTIERIRDGVVVWANVRSGDTDQAAISSAVGWKMPLLAQILIDMASDFSLDSTEGLERPEVASSLLATYDSISEWVGGYYDNAANEVRQWLAERAEQAEQ